MRIEILYFDGCPHYQGAVDLVNDILDSNGIAADVEVIHVDDPEQARRLRFLGSPSIRVDGMDVEPAARARTDYGFSCRTYNGQGLPPRELLEAAITGGGGPVPCCSGVEDPTTEVLPKGNERARWFASGSVAAAVVASACCWLPLGLAAAGLSAGGVAGVFERTRPYFLALTALFLAAGFFFAYRRQPACAPGDACATRPGPNRRWTRVFLWAATTIVVTFAAFPYYSGAIIRDDEDPASEMSNVLVFAVDGMTCAGCATTLENALNSIPGVSRAHVSYERKLATILPGESADARLVERVLAAIERAGFNAFLQSPQATAE